MLCAPSSRRMCSLATSTRIWAHRGYQKRTSTFAAWLFGVSPETVQIAHLKKDAVWSVEPGLDAGALSCRDHRLWYRAPTVSGFLSRRST